MVLGSAGRLGSSATGQAGDNVAVNAASGNLVIQNTDEMLIGLGLAGNDVLSRTYNSQGTFTANGWQESTQRQVSGLTGTVNTAGSTIQHTAWDGSVVTYTYNTTLGAYTAKEGDGPVDTLSFAGTTWTWRDGATRATETYDSANGGRIATRADLDGNTLTYTYTGALLTKVTTQDGEFTTLSYTGTNLTQVTTTLSGGATLTRVRYGYDASNRLTTVTVDLSPGDNAITDGKTYVTTYGYDGTSSRVASITQSDGSSLQIGYVAITGVQSTVYKVSSLTQSVGGTLAARVTTFAYSTTTPTTTVTDPLGLQTVLTYDTNGQLTKISAPPATTGATPQLYQFTYDALGDVLTTVAPSGATTTYTYDANGNQLTAVDPAGDTVTRTYGAANQLLTETVSPAAGVSLTTRYAYDALNHLRYVVSAQGDVTEYRYNTSGQQVAAIRYTANTYTTAGTITEATLNTWAAGIADKSTTQRTDTTYDFRGNVASVTSYARVLSTGLGDTTATVSTTNYVYDQAGKLLSRQMAGSSASETFVYDGLFRQTLATDLSGASTSVAFDDLHNKTVVTLANGATQTSTYDLAGELLSTAVSASGATTITSSEAYDADGRLRMTTDPTGVKTYFLYDNAGRKVADIRANGSIVEYRYNTNNLLVATIQYKGVLTSAQLASLVDASGNPAAVTLASLLPAADAGDRWTWNVYDAAFRLVETIDATGSVSVLAYDTASRLTSTTTYANFLTPTVVAGFKTTLPTALTLPTADATHDNVTRDFYDSDGRLIAVLDADGHLSQIVYDAAGEKLQTIRSANAVASSLWAAGTLAQLIASAATSSHDETTSYVYDAEGQLRFTIDANGRACEYVYDAAGNLLHKTEYAAAITTASSYSLAYVQSHLSVNAAADRTTRNVYDAANRLAFSIDAQGGVVSFGYDTLSHVVKQTGFAALYTTAGDPSLATMQSFATTNAGSSSNHVIRTLYDADGRAVYAVDAEGYVTESQYDLASRVTKQIRYASAFAVTDTTTTANLATAIGTLPSSAAVTSFTYDAAGRLTDVTDPMGFVTHSALDALGQVTDSTVAYGTGDASTTHYVYDAAGRVMSQTSAAGTAEAILTSFTYNGAGRLLTSTDGRNSITTYSYDAIGQLLSQSVPLTDTVAAVTSYQYDSFGNRVAVTDPRGNTGYFYYDNLNRLTLQVDPEGYVTQTAYSRGDQAISVTHYATRATGSYSAAVLPTYAAAAGDETTLIGRDNLDRVTSTRDAEGYTESYTLDAFGIRTTVTNKLGGVTTNAYDRRGLLVSETLPITAATSSGTASVVNTYSYDARGNKTQMVEAVGMLDTRTTTYVYDKNDRLTQKLVSDGTNETTQYDARGDIIETDTRADPALTGGAGLARTLYYYDHLGRKIASVDALGDMSTWAYDQANNMVTATMYGDRVALPTTPGGAPPSPAGTNLRQTFYTYDRGNRLISTRTPNVFSGQVVAGQYQTTTADVIVQTVYDRSGNVLQQIDARGNSAYAFYDKLGHKVAQVDQANYLTSYTLDADGNVLKEERFTTAVVGAVSSASDPAALRANVAKTVDDRITNFTYDRNGRRLTETRKGVNGIGPGVNAGPDSTVVYTYNGLGEVTLKQQATLDFTNYTYDAAGRQTLATNRSFVDYTGATVTPQTQTFYDGLNNVIQVREGAAGGAPSDDHVTTFAYSNGRLNSTTDADNNTTSFVYNTAGYVTDKVYNRTTNAGVVLTDEGTSYDLLGRAIFQQTQQTGVFGGDYTTVTYDAYGEVIAKGMNSLSQQTFDYDGAGRLYRTNSNGGAAQIFAYDAAGNRTLEIDSTTGSVGALGEAAIPALLGAPELATTYQVFDVRGQATQAIQKNRQLTASVTQDLTDTKVYNAFGEVSRDTDARGGVTDFSYNTMGKVILQQGPAVDITGENGVVTHGYRPTTSYGYDVSGRLHVVVDANGNLSNRRLIWGTGYDGTDPVAKDEFFPDGVVARGIDVFGNIRTMTNQIGQTETYTYDHMNRLITVAHAARSAANGGGQLIDSYAYDELGHQIAHWNNQLLVGGVPLKATTDYDAQGRVIKEVDFGGHATSYSYTWNSNLQTTGLGTFGGWTKATTYFDSGRSSYENIDYFGRTVGTTDLDGRVVTMTFSGGGQLLTRTGAAVTNSFTTWVGQSLTYTYFNTGKVASLTDADSAELTNYAYDAAGNQTAETVTGLSSYYDPQHLCGTGVGTILQDSHATYDAANRMITLNDSGRAGGPSSSITYAYDANGNIRNITSSYTDMVSHGTVTESDWYKYDLMNRVVTSKGILTGAPGAQSIVRGDQGVDLTYDAAGNRTSATRSAQTTVAFNAYQAPSTQTWVPPTTIPGTYVPGHQQDDYWVPAQVIPGQYHPGYTIPGALLTAGYYIYDSSGNAIGYVDPVYAADTYVPGYSDPDTVIPGYEVSHWVPAYTTDPTPVAGYYVTTPGAWVPAGTMQADLSHTEYYTYTEDGYLSTVSISDGTFDPATRLVAAPTQSTATLRSADVRDLLGRVTTHTEYAAGTPGHTTFVAGHTTTTTSTHTVYHAAYDDPGTPAGGWINECTYITPYIIPGQHHDAWTETVQDTVGVWVPDTTITVASVTGTAVYRKIAAYDASSNETHEDDATLNADGTTTVASMDFDYRLGNAVANTWNQAYIGGAVTHTQTRFGNLSVTQTAGSLTAALDGWTTGGLAPAVVNTTQAHTDYDYTTGAVQMLIHSETTGQVSGIETRFAYNGDGRLLTAHIMDGRDRWITYIDNALGQIISRVDSTGPREFYFNFAGMQRGDVGNNGKRVSDMDYAAAIQARQAAPQSGAFANNNTATSFADFDQNYIPINGSNDLGASSSYTVRDGDTLQSIAQAMWGDAGLWYLIADANGLSSGSALPAGMALSLPNKVINLHNSNSTFRVYDPNKAIGDVEPNVPIPNPQPQAASHKKHSCGVAQIIVAIVAVAVVALVAPYAIAAASNGLAALGIGSAGAFVSASGVAVGASFAGTLVGGALAGAVGSIVSQGVGLAIGAQDKFSWSGVALGAIGGAVGSGLGTVGSLSGNAIGGSTFLTGAVRGAVGSVISQGVGLATGLQSKFDWTSVAVAGIGGGVSNWASGQLAANYTGTFGQGGIGNSFVSGMAGGVAGAATRSLLTGTDFGDNLLADLPSIIGNTIGNAIASRFLAAQQTKLPEKSTAYDPGAMNLGPIDADKVLGSPLQKFRQDTAAMMDDLNATLAQLNADVASSSHGPEGTDQDVAETGDAVDASARVRQRDPSQYANIDMAKVAFLEGGNTYTTYGVGQYKDKNGVLRWKESSGITVGMGVDLHQRTVEELRSWNLTEDEIAIVKPLMGPTGEAAFNYPKITLDHGLVDKLNAGAMSSIFSNLVRIYDSESAATATPDYQPIKFANLPTEYATTIASLMWSGHLPDYRAEIMNNRWLDLADRLISTPKGEDTLRRQAEGQYLLQGIMRNSH
jgi:YD repeat-containing protein